MTPWISDRRAMLAGVVALGVVVLAFLGALLWLQFRVMQVHDRETFEALYRELELRREVDRFAGREALEIGLATRVELLPAAPYFALVDRRGAAVVGRLAAASIAAGRRHRELHRRATARRRRDRDPQPS
jgi:hypothetical protein